MIGIVLTNSLNTCPFIDKYLDVCKQLNAPYEVIMWDRTADNTCYPSNFKVHKAPSELYQPKWKKIGDFFRFRHFLTKTISEGRYDKLILLTSYAAVLCMDVLDRSYKGKYIFDFRDLTMENHTIFRSIVRHIVKNSAMTCISSPGFAETLGLDDFIMAHNFRYKDIEEANNWQIKPVSEPINLLHIGISRGESYNKKLADIFGNDKRFAVNIIGSGNDTDTFLRYAEKFDNIHVEGTYNNESKAGYIAQADALLYYYPCSFNCDRALANKYYDSMIYKKPLIGNINTYSGRRLAEKGLGISLDLDDPAFADRIYQYLTELNRKQFYEALQTEMDCVLAEDEEYLKAIKEFVKQ